MEVREPTYLEDKLRSLYEPLKQYLGEKPAQDPMAVLVAHVLTNDTQECESVEGCLANEPLLKAGRAYFALLVENDRLPPGEQITEEELVLPRSLLLDFFLERDDIQRRAQQVLGLIERKFSERAFKQANILLQLFETDQATKVQNERKLFYEDMIQRLGVRRRHPLSPRATEIIKDKFKTIQGSFSQTLAFGDLALGEVLKSDQGLAHLEDETLGALVETFKWLSEVHQINFCLKLHHPDESARWRSVANMGTSAQAQTMLKTVPPACWRLTSDFPDLTLMNQMSRHLMSTGTVREYMRAMSRTCYFILLAVGDTGLEDFIDVYFSWLEGAYGINGTEFIDRLHRESTLGVSTLKETLDCIFDDFFATSMETFPGSFKLSDLEAATRAFVQTIRESDLSEVAPGYFNLGGFLFDHLLGVNFTSSEFPFRIHRIV